MTNRNGLTRLALVAVLVAAAVGFPVGSLAGGPVLPHYLATFGGPGHAYMYPSGMAVGLDGSLVFADTGNNQVKKFDSTRTLQWSVGTSGSGVGQFTGPRDVGVDSSGFIYVADNGSDVIGGGRIVKLGSDGSWITTFKGPVGDFIGNPIGVSVSADKVYVADPNHHRVHVFDTSGNQLLSFTSNGVCTIGKVRDADADTAGNIYVANYDLNNVLKFDSTGHCLLKWGSKGATQGHFAEPYGVAIGTDPVLGTQAVYVADSNNERVQEFQLDGTFVTMFGSVGSADGQFVNLRRVAVAANGDVWGADLWGYRGEHFTRQSTGYVWAESIGGTGPPLTDTAVFNQVRGVDFDSSHDMVTVDTVNQRIVTFDPTGHIIQACGKRGDGTGDFNWPRSVAVDPATGQIWVANTRQNNLTIINPDCSVVGRIGKLGVALGQLDWPHSIAIRAGDGTAWVVDTLNNRIESWNVSTRQAIAVFGTRGPGNGQFLYPRGIAIDPVSGHIFVADFGNNRVIELSDTNGAGIAVVRTLTANFKGPQGVAVDGLENIYVADSGHSQVAVLQSNGTLVGEIKNGFLHPENVAVDQSTGNLFISDTYNDQILKYGY